MWNVNNIDFGMHTLVIKTDDIVDLTSKLIANGFVSPKISKQQKNVIADIYKKNKNYIALLKILYLHLENHQILENGNTFF